MRKTILSLLVPALLAGGGLSARAQTGVEAKPISFSVSQVPVQNALRTLFAKAGVRSVIAPDVQGTVNLSLDGVPFSVALKQVLGSVSPPLTAELQAGVYHVQGGAQASLEATPAAFPAPAEDAGQDNFYKIGIKHYDAGVIADAMTRRGGIILLPPNFVIPANSGVPGALAPPAVTTLGRPLAPGLPAAGANAPQGGPLTANNVLPPGVKRIFVLESDNSLVVEATPQGYDNLTGDRLLTGGYTQVY